MSNTSSPPYGTTPELPPSIVPGATENAVHPDCATQEFGGSGNYEGVGNSVLASDVASGEKPQSNLRDPTAILLGLMEGHELFQSDDGTPYAAIDIDQCHETLAVKIADV